MVKLLLLRHAKSEWSHSGIGDHGRPLAKRGTKAAPLMAAHIAKLNLKPDLILCSDAARTRATLELALPKFGTPPPDTVIDGELYLASAETILDIVQSNATDATPAVMVIAHNPGLHTLAHRLAVKGDKHAIRNMSLKFPTTALAVIEFDADKWKDIDPAAGTLTDFIIPRQLS
ncbi:MAG: histidine phosphatase family protein [Alphaproteobacteria bacterium]|nr:histidine phosphatase family protein [Alphaproteobacteria bacterium]